MHRVVRHIEVWSVFKVAIPLFGVLYLISMVSGFLLWRAADEAGTISGLEGFLADATSTPDFEIFGDVVFRAAASLGAAVAFLGVIAAVLGAVLFNLLSDLTGGVRMTVIDEDLIVAPARAPRRTLKRVAGRGSSRPPQRARR